MGDGVQSVLTGLQTQEQRGYRVSGGSLSQRQQTVLLLNKQQVRVLMDQVYTLSHSHSLTHTLSLARSLPPSLCLSLSLSHTHTFSLLLFHGLSRSLFRSLSYFLSFPL